MEGFTLIEIIITLTLVSVLAALLIPYMGTAMIRSGEPITLLNQTYEIILSLFLLDLKLLFVE